MKKTREKTQTPPRRFSRRKLVTLGVIALLLGAASFYVVRVRRLNAAATRAVYEITKEKISTAVQVRLEQGEFPEMIELPDMLPLSKATATYTIDRDIQTHIEKLFKSYRPDYGAFVAIDATSGRLLSMASYTRDFSDLGNLALKAAFPAASIFKIVTAAAAIDQNRINPETVIAFNGGYHTLYRRNVMENRVNKWTRHITLREAFAKSVNVVFGKIGMFLLEPPHLAEYAKRFQFNQAISADVPVEVGHFVMPDGDKFAIAELASGYNRVAVMSPLQGAMMAAAVANDGIMMEPFIVDNLVSPSGILLYRAQPKQAAVTMTPESASYVRELMRETVRNGTSRHAFRDLLRNRAFSGLEVGGKTGSLGGVFPKGKCDWFVGYAKSDGRKIAFAALTINEQNWRVKSSYLARSVIERMFRPSAAALDGSFKNSLTKK